MTRKAIAVRRARAAGLAAQRAGRVPHARQHGATLYVGKARDLKKRVSSYFQKTEHHPRTAAMVQQVAQRRNDGDALRRRGAAARKQPDQGASSRATTFCSATTRAIPTSASRGEAYPQLRFHRGTLDNHRYFGPFPSAGAVREGMALLQKVFQLRTCENSVFANRSRPCMLHQIQRCTGPCVGLISEADYQEDVRQRNAVPAGQDQRSAGKLQRQMERPQRALAFERAAPMRDKITRLQQLQSRQFVESATAGDIDVVAGVADAGPDGGQSGDDSRRPPRGRPHVLSAARRRRHAGRSGARLPGAALPRSAGAADHHCRRRRRGSPCWPRCCRSSRGTRLR